MVNTSIVFAEKNLSSFCIAKLLTFLQEKKINVFENTLATSVNVFVINKLIKLTIINAISCGLKSVR